MMLVVGGQGAGKHEYVRTLGYGDDDFSRDPSDDRPVLVDLHLLLRNTPGDIDRLVAELLRKDVVICNEVGCGIVPMDAEDRAWRDAVGRTCARLAAQADRVVRLCCGIPQCIKGGGL